MMGLEGFLAETIVMRADWDEKTGARGNCEPSVEGRSLPAFTLVELLVVISIISLLMAILLPALGKVRMQAMRLKNMNNQRQVVTAVNQYALDNDQKYPDSTAIIGYPNKWGWAEPTMITGYAKRAPGMHRSMGEYLGSYLADAKTTYCPSAPEDYAHLQDAWEAGDGWDNPDTKPIPDPVMGTYCFYWNYVGHLTPEKAFRGPRMMMGGGRNSDLLISDYFGFDHWRSLGAYGSCEKLPRAGIAPGTEVSSSFFKMDRSKADLEELKVALHAGYADGHVERYRPSETVPMKVIFDPASGAPYPSGVGPGEFYLPERAVR